MHQEQARQLAKQEMAAVGGAAADAAQTSLLLKRHRSYSSPGAPDASVTPRPGAQRLQRSAPPPPLPPLPGPDHIAVPQGRSFWGHRIIVIIITANATKTSAILTLPSANTRLAQPPTRTTRVAAARVPP